MNHVLITVAVLSAFGSFACSDVETRSEQDRADPVRRCSGSLQHLVQEQRAVACAEWFIARQGYTSSEATDDTMEIASEGIELESDPAKLLAARKNTLQSRAFIVCTRPDGYDVGFRYIDAGGARGVSMDDQFGSLRVEHADFLPATSRGIGSCRPTQADRPQ